MLMLIFFASDVGYGGGSCDASSCDLIGDGRLGRGELRNMLLMLIRESGSLAWLQPKYIADPRFKHMLTDYCKSPMMWTADAALHELVTYDSPPAIAAAPNLFSDTTRLSWEGLSKIMEVKRQAGGECTIEVLTRRWMDAATSQMSFAAALDSDIHEIEVAAEEVAGQFSSEAEEIGSEDVAIASESLPASSLSGGAFYVGPGFPLPIGVAAPAKEGKGAALRVNAAAAKRFVR
jgi:hypothetical protein